MKFLLPAAILILAAGSPVVRAGDGAASRRPNIIVVMPDDIGFGDYSFTGNPVVRTPAVDGFAKQSLRFTDFQVSPTCAPTRSSLLTGRHEFKNGVTHTIRERERLTLEATTLAQVLRDAGYATGIFGKWHLGDEDAYRPEKRGFDEVFIHGGGGIGQSYPGSCGDAPGNTNIDPTLWHNGRFEKTKGYCTDLFFDQALRWIDSRRADGRPFFALVTPNAAHDPHVVPEELWKAVLPRVAGRRNAAELAKFLAMVENIDANFGRLLGRLDEWNLAGDALVIYLAGDNGGTLGNQVFSAGLRGTKGGPYQGGTRTWTCWRWPGRIAGGKECPALVSRIDVFPTLAEIAGAKLTPGVTKQVEGRSLKPLLDNPAAAWADRVLFTHLGRWKIGDEPSDHKFDGCAARDCRFSLVNNRELYDLQADPGETTNVIESHPEEAAKLRAAYDQWWTETRPLLVNEDAYKTAPRENPFRTLHEKQFGASRNTPPEER